METDYSKHKTTYILLKDLPNCKAGDEFVKFKDGGYVCNNENIAPFGLLANIVENNPEWFALKGNQPLNNCIQHKKEVAGISDMKVLAEKVGDLHYESLSLFLYHLSNKFFEDGQKDFNAGRTQLAHHLFKAQMNVHVSHNNIDQAWKLSKPFMDGTK